MRSPSRHLALILAALQSAPAFAQNFTGPAASVPGGGLGLPVAAAAGAGTSLPGSAPTSLGTSPTFQPTLTLTPSITPQASVVPSAAVSPNNFGRMTGAVRRAFKDPGPVKRMWVVYRLDDDRTAITEALAKVKDANPGVEVVEYRDTDVIPASQEKGKGYDASREARETLFKRMLAEKTEFILAADQEIYEHFRGLRDSNLAREIPMGFAGRKYVSVDMPRASLDPAKLSDPASYPSTRYLVLGDENGAPAKAVAGMQGIRRSLEGAVSEGAVAVHGGESNALVNLGYKILMKITGQGDSRHTAAVRKQAHKLADYLGKQKIDVVATADPAAAEVLGLMKRMGYHKSLPVVWSGDSAPKDVSALDLAVGSPIESAGAWRAVPAKDSLVEALTAAKSLERLPDNFMEMGGVSVKDFEYVVSEAVDKALPGSKAKPGSYDIHLMLTNGNGVKNKGDANPFGHFGMAVTDENGKAQVWTVQYNDGGSFTGGLGDVKQVGLAEYLYTLWYLPGAVGQAIPLAETAVAPVYDFILRGVDEAQIEEMRRKAAEINARHLRGKDNYQFLNQSGMTNCISLVTQILRAAGFRIPETGVQDPAGQAYNMVLEFSRWILSGKLGIDDFGLVVFDRPAHAGPEHYRIANTAVAAPLMSRTKPWKKMNLFEKAGRILAGPVNLVRALRVPRFLEGFASSASHKVVVEAGSREAKIIENPDSPVLKLRSATANIAELRKGRVELMEAQSALENQIIAAMGFDGWQDNPAQSLEEKGRELSSDNKKILEAQLAAHHRRSIVLALNRLDEQIELRRTEFLVLELADPLRNYASKLRPIREGYKKILQYRNSLASQSRLLSQEEVEDLDHVNIRVEKDLEDVRLSLLKDAGPIVPQSIPMILGQVDKDTLADLKSLGERNLSNKGKAQPGK